jgi:hypothetical protein
MKFCFYPYFCLVLSSIIPCKGVGFMDYVLFIALMEGLATFHIFSSKEQKLGVYVYNSSFAL